MARVQFHSDAPHHRELSLSPEVVAQALDALAEADDVRRGPGWFDSSWDLACGLVVREGLPGDASLNEWLDVCLRA